MRRIYVRFIYNPFSGENKIISKIDYIIERYQEKGLVIVPYRLTYESGIDGALDGVDDSYDHILVAGGDGTVSSIVNHMKTEQIDIPLAVLPAGTANDFAKLLGFSSSITKACDQILEGRVKEIDIGYAGSSYFVNVLSTGLFTDISQKTPTKLKNTFGKLAYYFSSIQDLPNFKTINIKIDSDDLVFNDDVFILFVFNGRTAGNMNFAYRSSVDDGLLDVLIIKGDNIVNTITTAFHFLMGMTKKYPKGVVHFKTRRLNISSRDELTVDIDGELGPLLPIDVCCIEKGLRVIMPKEI